MIVKKTADIVSFIQRCERNLSREDKNLFLGCSVNKRNEKALQKALQKAGFAEFQNLAQAPSLFLSTKEWIHSPYHQQISLHSWQHQGFSYRQVTMRGGELFNVDAIQKDPQRELNDWLKLRAMDEDFPAIHLYQGKKEWMLDAPSEALTNDPLAQKAHGKVLTFGLGIGYFIYMALRNPQVKEITVIERSAEVLTLFREVLYPQFPQGKKIHFLQGDAFSYFKEEYLQNFDYVYVDIWQNHIDGLTQITRLLRQYNPPLEKVDFWIEDSCEQILWELIFRYFSALAQNEKYLVLPRYTTLAKKIKRYFSTINETLTQAEQCKFYMYDRATIRAILATKA